MSPNQDERTRYGSWGASLEPHEFSSALAAAGVAAASGAATLRAFRDATSGDGPAIYRWRDPAADQGWDPAGVPGASVWAREWRERTSWPIPHLEISLEPSGPDPEWVSQVLGSDAIPFLPLATDNAATSWRFPIRVGVLGNAAGRAFLDDLRRAAAAGGPWRRDLIKPMVIGRERITCDLLVLPDPPAEALDAVRRLPEVRAETILVRRPDGPWDGGPAAELARTTGASAIGVTSSVGDVGQLIWLCREISHNLPFDEAFHRIRHFDGVLLAQANAVGRHSAVRRARLTARRLASITESDGVDAAAAVRLAAEFDRVATEGVFESEGGGATELLELEQRAAPLLTTAAAERRVQARITVVGPPEENVATFRRGAVHRIEARIGSDDGNWLGVRAPFPVTPAAGPMRLLVVMDAPDLLTEPAVATISLPPTGASTIAGFEVLVPLDVTSVDARLLVLHGNRVLQTARLPRVADDGPAADDRPQAAEPEIAISAATDDTADRRGFDAAFVVGRDTAGAPRLTAVAGPATATIRLTEQAVGEAISAIRRELAEVVARDPVVGGLNDPKAEELLIFLAYRGVLIREAIERGAPGFTGTVSASRYVQIVSAAEDEFLPVEFAYDYPVPNEDARLCDRAVAALASPDLGTTCPGVHTTDVVCPFGFWGLSKVIERQAFRAETSPNAGFLLNAAPTRDRDSISLGAAILAASDRVDGFAAGSIDGVLASLQRSSAVSRRVDLWEDWTEAVQKCQPSLLLLLTHTIYSNAYKSYGLEIGAKARLWSAEIRTRLALPADPPVIAALLGCETARAGDIGYERFPALLRGAGVQVVIGTLTEVLGRHAAAIGRALVEELYLFCRDEPHGLGEVMLRVRRRLLADGVVTVLTLAAFGDADWLINAEEL
jgi:hypothetical protein